MRWHRIAQCLRLSEVGARAAQGDGKLSRNHVDMPLETNARAVELFFTTNAVGRDTGLGRSQACGFRTPSR